MVSLFLTAGLASAQEALRNSLAGQFAAEGRLRQLESRPYTLKTGDFRLLVTPSLGLDWNDNVNTAKGSTEQDFILRPMLQLNASYPLTAYNLLHVSVGVGYDQYFEHDEYSGYRLHTGSEVAFDIYLKDFRIDLHDRFQYTQDSGGQSAVAGTGLYGGFENTAGLSVDWDLQDLVLTVGFDHQNFISSSSQFEYTDRASELILVRAGFRLHPTVTAGVEGTVSFTTYAEQVLNKNVGYSAGVYADWRPGAYLQVQPRLGYTLYNFEQTSRFVAAVDQDAWYVGLTVSHQPSETVSYSLSAGHEFRLGIQADLTEVWYCRPTVNWHVIKNLTLQTSLFYEHGKQGVATLAGSLSETYDWYGGGLNLGYPVMKRLMAGLNYRFTLRSSDAANRDYTQNLAGLLLTYRLP